MSRMTTAASSEPAYTSDRPAIGSYQDALSHVGRTSPRYAGEVPVSEASVKMFCAMVQDANPAYWDREAAQHLFGGPVAPPALIQGTVLPLPWKPAGAQPQSLAVFAVPLPGSTLINVSTEAVYHRPFFAGETVTYYDEVVEISPERTTRLGTGHFITTVFHYEDEQQSPIATITNVMFRFGTEAAR
jgi:acyl dehydratase